MSCGSSTSSLEDAIVVDAASPVAEPEGEHSLTEVLESVLRPPAGGAERRGGGSRRAREGRRLAEEHFDGRCRRRFLLSWRRASTVERKRTESGCRKAWDAWMQITREPKAMLRGMRQELADMRRASQSLEQRLARRSAIGAACGASLLGCLLHLQRLRAGWRSRQGKLRGQLCTAGRRLDELERSLRSRDQALQGAFDQLSQKAKNDKRSLHQLIETNDTKSTSALSSMRQELKNCIGAKHTEQVSALGTLRLELMNLIKAEEVERMNALGSLRHDVKAALTDFMQTVNRRFWRRIRVPAISKL